MNSYFAIPYISHASKLGKDIPCINLPPHLSCRPDAPCAKLCYAKHGRFKMPACQNVMEQNWNILQEDREFFWKYVFRYFSAYDRARLFSSGDLPSFDDLCYIAKFAAEYPNTKILLFTKRFEFVNEYATRYAIPKNLTIVLSAWGDWCPPNPYNFPVSYVRLKNGAGKHLIPASAHECHGSCADCHEHSCWDLRIGESVVFNQH